MKALVVFFHMPRDNLASPDVVIDAKSKRGKRLFRATLSLVDDENPNKPEYTVIDYSKYGIHHGSDSYHGDWSYWFPKYHLYDELIVEAIEVHNVNNTEVMTKLATLIDNLDAEKEEDIIRQMDTPNSSIMTNDILIATLLGLEEPWIYDTDKLHVVLGEIGFPKTVVELNKLTGEDNETV